MSKLNLLLAVAFAITLSGSAYSAGGHGGGGAPHAGGMRGGGGGGHFGGAHFGGGGGRHFSGRSAISRSAFRGGRSRGNRSFALRNSTGGSASPRTTFNGGRNPPFGQDRQDHNANLRARAVNRVLNSHAVAGALHNRSALHNPGTRALIAASAATAGWHYRGGGGWWRHGNGGYGWVGPLFWPFAFYDVYDYAMWGYGYDAPFWGYGYNDIYAGIFAPYGYDDLTGYLPPVAARNRAGAASNSSALATANPTSDQLAQMCGEDSRDIAGLPIDRIKQSIQPDDAQGAALDDLANASVKAAQDIKAACPTQIALTAPSRLASMQQRVEAMIGAVGTVQSPLDKFYGLLNDEQKARLNALGQDQRGKKAAQRSDGSLAQRCDSAQPGVMNWPSAEIEATLHPTEDQRASLTALQDAGVKAAEMLKASCQPDSALTPPARLAAVGKRLEVMRQAVTTVRAALDDFYGKLSDEQKAQFEAIGPRRAMSPDQPAATETPIRRHHASVRGIVRHLISMVP